MPHRDTLLLTPGPLTTAPEVRQAMQRDWGSRDEDFIALTQRVRDRLTGLANGGASHTCVPIQGSGTFVIEAALGTFVPRDGKLLILANGAYGRRAAGILQKLNRRYELLESPEDSLPSADDVASALQKDPGITDVFLVHCETTSGILNPLEKIAAVVQSAGRRMILDAMSSFGGIPIDLSRTPIDVLAASSNKCLEGVPGIGFVLARNDHLALSDGCSPSLCLDLHDQWRGFEETGQWRFTPPTHALAALHTALDALDAENGVTGRFARYWENCRVLVDGMRALGFVTLLADTIQAPIIVTFRQPAAPAYDFNRFYKDLQTHGFSIYPGKLTKQPSFRVGCIGHVAADDMTRFIAAVGAVVEQGGITDCRPT